MTLQIIGIPQSNFVRAVRMVAEEKGVAYELIPAPPHSDDIQMMSPTGKVPGMQHRDLQLSESQAIARYIDINFDGPSLTPTEPHKAAKVEQWVSIAATDIDQLLMRNYVVEYAFHKDDDGNVIRRKIDRAVKRFPKMFEMIGNAVADGYFGTDSFSMADCFVTPILSATNMWPEGKDIIQANDSVREYFSRMTQRKSYKSTAP